MTEPETNSIIKEYKPKVKKNVISENTSKEVRNALEHVVALGSGRNAYIEGYRVGGKTGTAQKVENGRYMVGNYIVSFIGFMPANNPKIVLYVAIDNPKGITQYGGTVAAPVAKKILTDAIDILNIKKQDGGLERTYIYTDTKKFVVPDVKDKTLKEAIKLLDKFKIEYSGSGDTVVAQSPNPGESIHEGDTVKLFLSGN